MPLMAGKTHYVRSHNIGEMMKKFKRTGTIGNTKPRNKQHARRIAAAAAYRKSRKRAKSIMD